MAYLGTVRSFVFAALSALPLVACGEAPAKEPAPASAGPRIAWIADDTKAEEDAKSSHKPRVVDLRADWCGVCQKVDATVLHDPRVAKALERFVAARLDVTVQDARAEALGKKYEAEALPAIRVYDAGGKLVASLDGAIDAEALIAALEKAH